ncbi:MAG: efflux RND transporter permease subunit, partial [Nitrospirota bacterium]
MIELAIRKKKVVILFAIMLFIYGLLTLYLLPRREIPETDLPMATILTIYPGAEAEQVEKYVTNRIEDKLSGVREIEEVTSTSSAGVSNIVIVLKEGTDKDKAWNLIRQKIKEAQNLFPDGVHEPNFNDALNMQGISLYMLKADTYDELFNINQQLEAWERRFNQIPGVARALIQGMPEQEVLIRLHAEKMRHLNLDIAQIMGVIYGE